MDITLEQLKRINEKYPELISQLQENVMNEDTNESVEQEQPHVDNTWNDTKEYDFSLDTNNDDDDGIDDDYDDDETEYYYDDEDEDYVDEDEPRHHAVVSTTSARVSIFVNEQSFAYNITEVPSAISALVKRLIKPMVKEDLLVTDSEINELRTAQIPRLAKLITQVSKGAIAIENNGVTLDGEVIGNNNMETLLQMARDNNIRGIAQFIRFQRSLENNTSARVIDRLYDFIKCTSIDIDDEGNIIAYKAINADLYDCYTGKTYINSEGAVIEMPRKRVNDNDHETCSTGLHVCAISYLKGFFWSRDKRLAIVKIKPEDFVSIPVDYNDAKARVCKYTVSKVCTIEEAEKILEVEFHDTSVDDFDDTDYDEYEDMSDFL